MTAEVFSERGLGQTFTRANRYDILSPRKIRQELLASLKSRPIVSVLEERISDPTPRSFTGARRG